MNEIGNNLVTHLHGSPTEAPRIAKDAQDTLPEESGASDASMLTSGAENGAGESTGKRRPGRPKGLGKVPGSGKKKGSPNLLTASVRKYILERGKPLEKLFKIANGHKVTVGGKDGQPVRVVPSLGDQMKAATVLLDRAVPSLRGTELSGPDAGPVKVEAKIDAGLGTSQDLARRLSFLLESAKASSPKPSAPTASLPVPTEASVIIDVPVDAEPVPLAAIDSNNLAARRVDNFAMPAPSRPVVTTKRNGRGGER